MKFSKSLNYKFISEQFAKNEIGYANIFKEYYDGYIYVLNTKAKYGYIWNSKTKLYEQISDIALIPVISELLQCVIDEMISTTQKADVLDDQEKMKKIKSLTDKKIKFGSVNCANNIYKFILSLYKDEEKIGQFDNCKNIITITSS